MINTPKRLSQSIVDLVTQATEAFSEGVDATQNNMLRTVLGLIRELKTDKNGNIKRTAENMKALTRIKRSLKDTILTKAYKSRVEAFMKQYGILGDLNNEYFAFLIDAFRPNEAIFDALKEDAIEQTLSAFTGAGLDANLLEPAKTILNQNIRNGGSVFDLEQQMRDFIVGIAEGSNKRLGTLERYTGQMTRDLLNQFSANYHFNTTSDLGLEWFLYSGGTVEDSRVFCIDRHGRIFHKKEIEGWASLSWQGKIEPGTTSTTIWIYRGGWRCQHFFGAVAESAVPESDKARARSKGLI